MFTFFDGQMFPIINSIKESYIFNEIILYIETRYYSFNNSGIFVKDIEDNINLFCIKLSMKT